MLCTAMGFAQETEHQDTNAAFDWYAGIGMVFNPDYNINSNLKSAGVKELPGIMPSFTVGWNVIFKNNLSLGMELGSAYSFHNRKKDGSQLVQVPASLKVHYVLAQNSRLAFSAGADVSVVASSVSVFSDDTEIDMGNLNPETNTGYLLFRNTSWFAGPSAALRFLDANGHTSSVLSIGYGLCFTNSKWKSDYAKITNPVRESGNRFYISLYLPFGK